jgi:hypothetical protein
LDRVITLPRIKSFDLRKELLTSRSIKVGKITSRVLNLVQELITTQMSLEVN